MDTEKVKLKPIKIVNSTILKSILEQDSALVVHQRKKRHCVGFANAWEESKTCIYRGIQEAYSICTKKHQNAESLGHDNWIALWVTDGHIVVYSHSIQDEAVTGYKGTQTYSCIAHPVQEVDGFVLIQFWNILGMMAEE